MEKSLLAKKAKRFFKIQAELEKTKELYSELDQLTFDLKNEKGLDQFGLALVDNFADKNTVFRPCAIRRWELKKIA